MIIKFYKNNIADKIVEEEESVEYALDKLGMEIKPLGKNGEYTSEQSEFLTIIRDSYFSTDWTEGQRIERTFEDVFGKVEA